MKVWKKIGAVRVYSKPRATILVIASVLLIAAAGFGVGVAVAGGDDDSSGGGSTATAATVAKPAPTKTTTVRSDPPAAPTAGSKAAKRAYARGYRAGAVSVFPSNEFKAGGAYAVRLKRGVNGALHVVQHMTVVAGKSYFICANGTRLCIGASPG